MQKVEEAEVKKRINRYIMECKWIMSWLQNFWSAWINRYIMECKWCTILIRKEVSKRINRYIMECKFCRENHDWWCVEELIDTLWNVNWI